MISTLYLFLIFWCFKFDVERLIAVFRFRMKVPFNHDFCYYRFIIGLCCCWDGCFRVKDVCVGVISYQDVIYLILMWVFFSVHHIYHIYLFRQSKVHSFKFKYLFFDFTFSGVSSCIFMIYCLKLMKEDSRGCGRFYLVHEQKYLKQIYLINI